ncbi:MAG TPA: type II secretion system F family protein [Candidatus Baltobacteraceae bacterium]|jgi:tight adherence protein C|nr:type II secretion system F family protein [Candidatus Baltobacteraceae bacterium]
MSPMLIFGLAILLIGGGLTAVFFLYRGNDVHRRLAELNLDAPTQSAQGDGGGVAIHKLLDDSQKRTLARKLTEGGWYDVTPVKMMAYMLIGGGIGAVLGVLAGISIGTLDVRSVGLFLVLTIVGFATPNGLLDRAIGARKKSIQRELPNFLDMVSTSVEAGTALSQSLNIAMDAVAGPLHQELELVNDDIRLGRSRGEALAAMAHRVREPDLTTCVTAIVQAERLGGNIANVLLSLSTEARERRMLRAEEIAATLPVKMVFPMAFFMLPSLLLIIFGGIAAQYFK